jgi:hypothetical protein
MVGQIQLKVFKELWDKVAWCWHCGWKKGFENFFPKHEAKASCEL